MVQRVIILQQTRIDGVVKANSVGAVIKIKTPRYFQT